MFILSHCALNLAYLPNLFMRLPPKTSSWSCQAIEAYPNIQLQSYISQHKKKKNLERRYLTWRTAYTRQTYRTLIYGGESFSLCVLPLYGKWIHKFSYIPCLQCDGAKNRLSISLRVIFPPSFLALYWGSLNLDILYLVKIFWVVRFTLEYPLMNHFYYVFLQKLKYELSEKLLCVTMKKWIY